MRLVLGLLVVLVGCSAGGATDGWLARSSSAIVVSNDEGRVYDIYATTGETSVWLGTLVPGSKFCWRTDANRLQLDALGVEPRSTGEFQPLSADGWYWPLSAYAHVAPPAC